MKDVNERIAALPEEKRMALLQHLQRKAAARAESPTPAVQPSPDAWVLRYRPNDQARLRLFCFPYAGGRASIFRSWADDVLPADIEVCSIQLPGREERLREPPYKRLAPLVQELAEALVPYLDRPFAFYGHSMGALVSFEVARQLRKEYDRHPVALFLAAFRAPQLPNPNIKIYHLPTEVFKVVLRADGIPETILQSEELMQLMLPTLRADYEVCDTYEYREEPPLSCPFFLYSGVEDIRIREADMVGWPVHTAGLSRLSMVPGSHLFLHTAQDFLLAEISRNLEMCL
ncbi:MAG TPA: alpha/beta fold hydrolase, partial [Ktedonobacteraceae bacterium]|nr:alpha/beta fold hydrolase [Ktedonobacteraceae bacterium]